MKRLSADDTGGATPCGKYAIARRLFLYLWSFNPGILRKKAVKPFLLPFGGCHCEDAEGGRGNLGLFPLPFVGGLR